MKGLVLLIGRQQGNEQNRMSTEVQSGYHDVVHRRSSKRICKKND